MRTENKTDDAFIIRVECHAGYRGEESPRRFFLHQRKVEVLEILDRWLAPDHRYFKLKGDDEAVYIIRYDGTRDQWQLIMFDSGLAEDPPHSAGT